MPSIKVGFVPCRISSLMIVVKYHVLYSSHKTVCCRETVLPIWSSQHSENKFYNIFWICAELRKKKQGNKQKQKQTKPTKTRNKQINIKNKEKKTGTSKPTTNVLRSSGLSRKSGAFDCEI